MRDKVLCFFYRLFLLFTLLNYVSLCMAKVMPPTSSNPISVYTERVNIHEISPTLTLIGKLQAENFVNIASEVMGKVSKILVSAGQKVKKDDLLLTIDDMKVQAALLEAQAYFKDENRKLKEYAILVKKYAVTQTQMDGQAAQADIAFARLKSAKADVRFYYIRAPFSGTIGLIDFSQGKIVSAGSELLTLDALSIMHLDLKIPERYLAQLVTGLNILATSEAWPNQVFSGNIIAIDPRINADSLNLRVRVEFNNPDNKLKPGMLMSAEIVFPVLREMIIPMQALEYLSTKRFVYVVDKKNKVHRQEVILGARIKDNVVIKSGINIGDKIVVKGVVNMREGLVIKDLTTNVDVKNKAVIL